MSQNITVFRHFQSLFQTARGLLPRIMETEPNRRPACLAMEPYMDALPTRRPLPRSARARRVQDFMQMAIDA